MTLYGEVIECTEYIATLVHTTNHCVLACGFHLSFVCSNTSVAAWCT